MRKLILTLLATLAVPLGFGAQATYDSDQRTWTLSSNRISAVFQLTSTGFFQTVSVTDVRSGDQWVSAQGGLPVRFTAGPDTFDDQRPYLLIDQHSEPLDHQGVRQTIVLQDLTGVAQITLTLDVYDYQQVLHYAVRYHNAGGMTAYVTDARMLSWAFADQGQRYTALRVNQWSTNTVPLDFEQTQTLLDTDGTGVDVFSGAGQKHCSWLAIRDTSTRGLVAGWEFDGSAKATVAQSSDAGTLQLTGMILNLNHPVPPGADFDIPAAFIGTFHGDFDEAGYRTQRFVDSVLAMPAPAQGAFPYVAWDSWGYGQQIDEQTLMKNADAAAKVGAELFIVDLGWARGIGDWYADETKFPHGLRAVSDYVHSLGMKFGLHMPLSEADPNSPVLQSNPDWTTSETLNYFGAVALCLGNQPTQDWIVAQILHVIDDYGVDWITQDGAEVVEECDKTTHTHDPADSNYANSVSGLDAIVTAVQAARPSVLWENCENGGNMMTFNMVKHYVTSVTNDASGALQSRRAVYGATYPFPPRYTERYMPDSDGVSMYGTHSYFFGGPWILMNQLASLSNDQIAFLTAEVQNYKDSRVNIAGSKVFHILAPAEDSTDVIQSYNRDLDSAIAVITRANSPSSTYVFKPRGLTTTTQYTVTLEVGRTMYSMSGSQLMSSGIRVPLPTEYSSEIVHIDHQ